jgi:hypothetical protein
MSKVRWEQMAAGCGLLFVVLQLIAQGLIQIGGSEPSFNAPAGEIISFFENRERLLFNAGGFLSAISMLLFIWFLGALWARLRRSEEAPAWMSLVAFGSALAGVAVSMANDGWGLAVFRIEEGLDPQLARYLFDEGNFGFATLWVFLAGFLFTASIVTLHDGALPLWLGWLGLVAAVALLTGRAFWDLPSGAIFIPYMLFYLWLIAASIVLVRAAGREREPAGEQSERNKAIKEAIA